MSVETHESARPLKLHTGACHAMAPKVRTRTAYDHQVNAGGAFVLYWMVAFRRTREVSGYLE